MVNSMSGHNKLPTGAKQIDIYEYISGQNMPPGMNTEPPDDLTKWQYLGIAKHGKFINHFTADQLGQTVWYIAVYIDNKTLKPAELAGKVKATII